MKIKNLLPIFPLLFGLLFISCNKDEDGNGDSFITFAVSGPLMNGDFEIRQKKDVDFGLANGFIVPADADVGESALITYQDENSSLVASIALPAKSGKTELLFNDPHHISITYIMDDSVILASKMVSMNVTKFKKKSVSLLPIGTMDMSGNFEGIMVWVDASTNEEYTHTITGRFVYNGI